jgi:L-threonylcarbamoyladenylate synthase
MFQFENDIQFCLTQLDNGGLILYPTDTVWGIGCDATNEEAVKRIFNLKKRVDSKAMIVLVENEAAILNYVAINELQILITSKASINPLRSFIKMQKI